MPERLQAPGATGTRCPVGWEQLDYPTFLERRRTLHRRGRPRRVQQRSGTSRSTHGRVDARRPHRRRRVQTVEFKSTARWNVHTEQADPKIEHVIVKTVCGFLNAEGGTLLIGVDDDGDVLGPRARPQHAWQQVEPSTATSCSYVSCSTPTSRSRPPAPCGSRFEESAAGRPSAWSRLPRPASRCSRSRPRATGQATASEFWVRIGNATKQLHGDDMVDYQARALGLTARRLPGALRLSRRGRPRTSRSDDDEAGGVEPSAERIMFRRVRVRVDRGRH